MVRVCAWTCCSVTVACACDGYTWVSPQCVADRVVLYIFSMGTDSVRGPQGELPLSRLAGVQSAAETVARVLQTADSSLHPKEVVKRTVSHLVDATAFDLRDKRDGSLTGFAFKYSLSIRKRI